MEENNIDTLTGKFTYCSLLIMEFSAFMTMTMAVLLLGEVLTILI